MTTIMPPNMLFSSVLLITVISEVGSQICTKAISYRVTYTASNSLTATKWQLKTVQECCHGFFKNTTTNSCQPYCENGCPNGKCLAPNFCQCNQGWKLKLGICQPICHPPCQDGVCISPNTCECTIGYDRINGTCVMVKQSAEKQKIKDSGSKTTESDEWLYFTIAVLVLILMINLALIILLAFKNKKA